VFVTIYYYKTSADRAFVVIAISGLNWTVNQLDKQIISSHIHSNRPKSVGRDERREGRTETR